jgi:hypothetical protein
MLDKRSSAGSEDVLGWISSGCCDLSSVHMKLAVETCVPTGLDIGSP